MEETGTNLSLELLYIPFFLMWGLQLWDALLTKDVKDYGPNWHMIAMLLLTFAEFPLSLIFLPIVALMFTGKMSLHTVTNLHDPEFTVTFRNALRDGNAPALSNLDLSLPAFEKSIELEDLRIYFRAFPYLSFIVFFGREAPVNEKPVMATFRNLIAASQEPLSK